MRSPASLTTAAAVSSQLVSMPNTSMAATVAADASLRQMKWPRVLLTPRRSSALWREAQGDSLAGQDAAGHGSRTFSHPKAAPPLARRAVVAALAGRRPALQRRGAQSGRVVRRLAGGRIHRRPAYHPDDTHAGN